MGIDRIGKGPTIAPTSAGQSSPGSPVERPFSVNEAAGPLPPSPVGPPGALAQLQAGTIDLARYLDMKVDEATSHLGGAAPAQLDAIRAAVRDRLSQDPTLIDLVRKATGAVDVALPPNDE